MSSLDHSLIFFTRCSHIRSDAFSTQAERERGTVTKVAGVEAAGQHDENRTLPTRAECNSALYQNKNRNLAGAGSALLTVAVTNVMIASGADYLTCNLGGRIALSRFEVNAFRQ
ncbi:hypothetical protein EVAR_6526_1 [Eumeta japonica]|uniref:Uncharacterized protein n=1 Tax=Eumeta variegata TaxID=151549 RepID=A0A4C1SSK8_EUMVA|nr:hypothetical protein EVAR_6526_1 [Eumeta japonica]